MIQIDTMATVLVVWRRMRLVSEIARIMVVANDFNVKYSWTT